MDAAQAWQVSSATDLTTEQNRSALARHIASGGYGKDGERRRAVNTIVEGKLYLGGEKSTKEKSLGLLFDRKVTHVLVLSHREDSEDLVLRLTQLTAFKELRWVVQGDAVKRSAADNLACAEAYAPKLFEILDFMDTALKPGHVLLVRCTAGISRSATAILAWLITRCAVPYEQGLRFLQARRIEVSPADEFEQYLQLLSQQKLLDAAKK